MPSKRLLLAWLKQCLVLCCESSPSLRLLNWLTGGELWRPKGAESKTWAPCLTPLGSSWSLSPCPDAPVFSASTESSCENKTVTDTSAKRHPRIRHKKQTWQLQTGSLRPKTYRDQVPQTKRCLCITLTHASCRDNAMAIVYSVKAISYN